MFGNRKNQGGFLFDTGEGCLVWLLIGIVAMPILGLYLAGRKNSDAGTRVLGWILFVVGMLIWVFMELRHG